MIDKLTLKNSDGKVLFCIESSEDFSCQVIEANYHKLTEILIKKGITVTTMESCTSGLIASLITDSEGASIIFKGGFVTYSNEAKILNGVSESIINDYGVYSPETAKAMAKACREFYDTDIGIGVTGTLGNTDPANADSVSGKIFIGISTEDETIAYNAEISGLADRVNWKLAVAKAVFLILERGNLK
ncbi:MAG: CinA family protein [Clostridia bacterium]|nr:CinA family protein [Clostridia bacterium]